MFLFRSYGCVMIVFPETSIIQVFFLNYSMYLSHSLSAYRPREIPLNIVDDRLTKVKRWGAGEKKRKRKRERGRGRNRWND